MAAVILNPGCDVSNTSLQTVKALARQLSRSHRWRTCSLSGILIGWLEWRQDRVFGKNACQSLFTKNFFLVSNAMLEKTHAIPSFSLSSFSSKFEYLTVSNSIILSFWCKCWLFWLNLRYENLHFRFVCHDPVPSQKVQIHQKVISWVQNGSLWVIHSHIFYERIDIGDPWRKTTFF